MNPINFLDEKNIFMFESNYINTGVSDASYIAIVNSRLANYAISVTTIKNTNIKEIIIIIH